MKNLAMGKSIKLVFLFLILFISGFAQKRNIHISGNISGIYFGKVYMFYENDFKHRDSISSTITDGRFQFNVYSKLPVLIRLHMGQGQQISFIGDVYIDDINTVIYCTDTVLIRNENRDTLNKFIIQRVTGSTLQNSISDFHKNLGDEDEQNHPEVYFRHLYYFITNHSNSIISPYLVSRSSNLNFLQLDTLKNLIDTSLFGTYEYNAMLSVINHVEKTSKMLDSSFHDVTLRDTNLHEINTKEFRNKYTLIIFWASWCVPCRNEHPALNDIYTAYRTKGLTILGISLDKDANDWKKAIRHDGLKWPQLVDLKSWEGEISKTYAISAIPYNILIDSKGTIIAKNLSISEIYSSIAKIFL